MTTMTLAQATTALQEAFEQYLVRTQGGGKDIWSGYVLDRWIAGVLAQALMRGDEGMCGLFHTLTPGFKPRPAGVDPATLKELQDNAHALSARLRNIHDDAVELAAKLTEVR